MKHSKVKIQDLTPATSLIVALFLLTYIACVGEIDEAEDSEARIILGRSIDGVIIGDDSLTVISKLGEPDTIVGDDFQGVIFKYFREENPHSFMMVSIIQDTSLLSGTAVLGIEVQSPYPGETKEGVGIGTERKEAVRLLGEPILSDSSGSVIEDYYYVSPPSGVSPTGFFFAYDFGERKSIRIMMGPAVRHFK